MRLKSFAWQWQPNLAGDRLVLTRVYWNRGTPGDGKGYSTKVSLSICLDWPWIGMRVCRELWGCIIYIGLIPCFSIRLHWKRAYGGRYC